MHAIRMHKDKLAVTVIIAIGFTCLCLQLLSMRIKRTSREIELARINLVKAMKLRQPSRTQVVKDKKSYEYITTYGKPLLFGETGHTNKKLFILTFGGKEFSKSLEVLNNRNDVIYWHEPMKMFERLGERWRGNDLVLYKNDPLAETNYRSKTSQKYTSSAEFYTELFSCKFTPKILGFLENAVKLCPDYLVESRHLREILECREEGFLWSCEKPTQSTVNGLNKLCRQRKYNVIVKESEERTMSLEYFFKEIPESITNVLDVLHLVRDPRAVVYEFSLGGRVERNPSFRDVLDKVEYACGCLTKNLRYGKEMANSYHLFRYEDLLENKDIMSGALKLAPSSTELPSKTSPLGWWRKSINRDFSSTVENICWLTMEELGYLYLDGNIRGDKMSYKKIIFELPA